MGRIKRSDREVLVKLAVLHEYWAIPGGIPYDLTNTSKKPGDMSFLKEPKDKKRFIHWMNRKPRRHVYK